MNEYKIAAYAAKYQTQCLAVFASNIPVFFAENEAEDFQQFLAQTDENYKIVLDEDRVIGCFGLTELVEKNSARISWIMISPDYHGKGAGKAMMLHCLEVAKNHQLKQINIAASHLSAPFFEHYGAEATNYIENGWGHDMHRIDMILSVE